MSNLADNKLYKVWYAMNYRCYDKKSNSYSNYGARGITVCDEWRKDFKTFESWALNNGYSEGLSIERINVNGNYCPENCTWATHLEQCNNMRRNIFVTYLGKTKTLAQWSREMNRTYESRRDSYYRGTFPPTEENAHRRRNKLIEYDGKRLTMKEWAVELNVSYASIKAKVKRGTFPPTDKNAHKRKNKLISYNGEALTMKEWSVKLGITYNALKNRVYRRQFSPQND